MIKRSSVSSFQHATKVPSLPVNVDMTSVHASSAHSGMGIPWVSDKTKLVCKASYMYIHQDMLEHEGKMFKCI